MNNLQLYIIIAHILVSLNVVLMYIVENEVLKINEAIKNQNDYLTVISVLSKYKQPERYKISSVFSQKYPSEKIWTRMEKNHFGRGYQDRHQILELIQGLIYPPDNFKFVLLANAVSTKDSTYIAQTLAYVVMEKGNIIPLKFHDDRYRLINEIHDGYLFQVFYLLTHPKHINRPDYTEVVQIIRSNSPKDEDKMKLCHFFAEKNRKIDYVKAEFERSHGNIFAFLQKMDTPLGAYLTAIFQLHKSKTETMAKWIKKSIDRPNVPYHIERIMVFLTDSFEKEELYGITTYFEHYYEPLETAIKSTGKKFLIQLYEGFSRESNFR